MIKRIGRQILQARSIPLLIPLLENNSCNNPDDEEGNQQMGLDAAEGQCGIRQAQVFYKEAGGICAQAWVKEKPM